MRKKYTNIALFSILIATLWIYWSASREFESTLLILRENNTFIKDYLIRPTITSSLCAYKTFLVIIVTSYVGHVELRSAHRRAMPEKLLNSMNMTRLFLLAEIPSTEKSINQKAIEDESIRFGDILQGSFTENYRNLVYKHLMGLQWAAITCQKATYILKVDDDTVFSLEETFRFLESQNFTDDLLLGYVLRNTKPRRNKRNKWYVTWDEFSKSDYPAYLSGWYYITTPKLAKRLTDEAVHHTKLWIDDIFVTGIITEYLNIKLKALPENYWLEYYELLECCLRDMVQKSIKCEYVVAPNGNRNNLLVEYNGALRNCNRWKNCTNRPVNKPLKRTCVTFRDRTIFSNGKPEVKYIGG